MALEIKSYFAEVTAQPEGHVLARVSAFTPDKLDDQVARYAFDGPLARAQAANRRWPLLHEHSRKLEDHLGSVDSHKTQVMEDGLHVWAEFNLKKERAREAYEMVRDGVLTEWSIGFLAKWQPRPNGARGRLLTEIELVEISLTAKGVSDTATLEMKSEDIKAALAAHRRALVREQLAPYRAQLDMAQRRLALAHHQR